MRNPVSNSRIGAPGESSAASSNQSGSQTLLRGLDVIDAVADGPITLADMATKLQLSRSTVHRLASALIERRYLTFVPRIGYQLGPRLLALGHQAQQRTDIVQVARPYLETLASVSEDTVHLAVLDNDCALYLAKIPGRRRVNISSRIGERQPLTSTGVGKALLLDEAPDRWLKLFADDRASSPSSESREAWLKRMHSYAEAGYALDLEENEDMIRCVAAPIRGASGSIAAAISVSSAAQYMSDDRMEILLDEVTATARMISADLGWSEDVAGEGKRPGKS